MTNQTIDVTYTPGEYDRQPRQTRRFEGVTSFYSIDSEGRRCAGRLSDLRDLAIVQHTDVGPRIIQLANVADVRVVEG